MVDAEDLLFLENMADGVVQFLCGSQIAADRLFNDDAGRAGDELVLADLVGNIAENAGRDGQIEGAHALLALVQQLLQHVPAIIALGIDWHVEKPVQEGGDLRIVIFAGLQVLLQRVLREFAIFLVGHDRTRRANDAGRLRELAFDLPVIKGRQKLALGKIARAAENDTIKRFNRNDLTAHIDSLDLQRLGHQ